MRKKCSKRWISANAPAAGFPIRKVEAFSGYKQIGHTTYWVEYRIAAADCKPLKGEAVIVTYELVNAYAHRMKIELEAVWNGKKTDPDM